jgi:Tol biopolymer transport system component/tRNA A-37 threonylcarbamoyl transferase component Bud32
MTAVDRLTAALADRYTIERELGQGGMATVYLAQDLKHDRKVAIKVLRPELAAVIGAERFVVEIKTTAALQHPHILPLFDSGEADGFLYYVMPFIDGETLRDKLNRETQFGIDEAVRIATEVADALHYAHQNGVVHRDIKPENILLANGRPMVADFGIALALSAAAGGRMTETGMSLGTPHYMSPEQATAEKEITARSDVYSLGSVLYEMLAGEPPHLGGSAQQIIMKIIAEPVQPVTALRKAVPHNVAAAVAKSLEKLPADRFTSAAAFAAALANPGFTVAGLAGAVGMAPASTAAARRLPWVAAAVFGGVALALGMMLMRGDHAAPTVVRFEMTLPEGQQLNLQRDEDTQFALSPDGTRIAYSAIDSATGVPRIYLRSIDQLEGAPLPGTEGGIAPFFSPDGRWVAFTADRTDQLKKVPVTGGAPIILAEQVGPGRAGGSWGDDNTIVFNGQDFELNRVSGAGGNVAVVPLADTLRGAAFWPSMLPGSKAALVEYCLNACTDVALAVLDLASGKVTPLIPGGVRGWYLRTGHLVYVTSDGGVFAAQFDLERLEVSGDPVPLLAGVQLGSINAARLAIADSAGAMMYQPAFGRSGRVVVEVDRSGVESPLPLPAGDYDTPRWSPSRDRIALGAVTDDGTHIVIYDRAAETLTQMTSTRRNVRPSWSPDGDRLVFWTFGGTADLLQWMPSDGSRPPEAVLPPEITGVFNTTFWTRDGAWIVFDGTEAGSDRNNEDIFAIGTGSDRGLKVVVSSGADEQAGAVSPDGRWIAYGSTDGGVRQVYVRPFLAEGGRYLISTGPGWAPLWAGNDELVYIDEDTDKMVSARLEVGDGIRVRERQVLFDASSYYDNSSVWQWDVSRDGQRFLMLRNQDSGIAGIRPVVVLNWFEEVTRRMAEQGSP